MAIMSKIRNIPYQLLQHTFSKVPIRLQLVQLFLKHLPFIPHYYKVLYEAVERPFYAYCILNGLIQAKALGYKKASILEFGVAGGNGLVNIENHVLKLAPYFNIEVEIYGFDLAKGLPKPKDYRDLTSLWKEGMYKMDIPKLTQRLQKTKLVLGNVKKTVKTFKAAPIAAVLFDLDYYSSTINAFDIFKKPHLPRVFCYFDNVWGNDEIHGNEASIYNEYTGEQLAIKEFNQKNKFKKLAKISNRNTYQNKLYIMHDFKHPKYGLPLNQLSNEVCELK